MRITKQRKVILEQLKKHKDHPGADIIYAEVREIMPKISLGTVYRNLEKLAESGTILKIESGTGHNRFDPTADPHPHFRCLKCGKVEDIPLEINIPVLSGTETWVSDRKISGATLEYYGCCSDCITSG